MLNNATGFRKIYIAAGYIDLRRGIDGLASIIKFNFQLDPYEKDILFSSVADAVTASRDFQMHLPFRTSSGNAGVHRSGVPRE